MTRTSPKRESGSPGGPSSSLPSTTTRPSEPPRRYWMRHRCSGYLRGRYSTGRRCPSSSSSCQGVSSSRARRAASSSRGFPSTSRGPSPLPSGPLRPSVSTRAESTGRRRPAGAPGSGRRRQRQRLATAAGRGAGHRLHGVVGGSGVHQCIGLPRSRCHQGRVGDQAGLHAIRQHAADPATASGGSGGPSSTG